MCGIAGYLSNGSKKSDSLRKLSRALLNSIEDRGRDATGYAYIDDDSTMVEKRAMTAGQFLAQTDTLLAVKSRKKMPTTLLLHTRHATQGSPSNNENNHPLYSKVSGLTLIHNGWLLNEEDILDRYPLEKDADVDSETCLRLIEMRQKRGLLKSVKKAMSEMVGAFSCALMSEKFPNTLWLWRRGNPLFIYTGDGLVVFASTERAIIRGLTAMGETIDHKKLNAFPEHFVLRMALPGSFDYGKLPKPRTDKTSPETWRKVFKATGKDKGTGVRMRFDADSSGNMITAGDRKREELLN